MYPTSEKFLRSVSGSHRPFIVVKAKSIDGSFVNLPVVSGSVTIDRTSQDIRRTCSLTLNSVDLVPVLATDPLNIYGNHIYVYRGVLWHAGEIPSQLWDAPPPLNKYLMRFDNLTSTAPKWALQYQDDPPYELVPLGVFRINEADTSEDTDGNVTISLNASDISANISKNAWTGPVTVWNKPYKVPVAKTKSKTQALPEVTYVATGVQEAIKLLINDRWGNRKSTFGEPRFEFGGVANKPLTKPVVMGSNTVSTSGSNSPWTDITGLAAAIGAELFVDNEGAFRLQAIPDPNTISPVWDYFDGEGGLLTNASRKLNDSKAVNYVIASGENTSAKQPLKAIAYDGDPASPTYYKGEFGRVVGRESGRKKLNTQAEVQHAADTYLNWFVGGDETVSIEGIVNPALDTGDVIRVRRKRIGIYNAATVITELNADFPNNAENITLSEIVVAPLKKGLAKGQQLVIYTTSAYDTVVLTNAVATGGTTLAVSPFRPQRQYRKGTIIFDPTDLSNVGSVPHYIDSMTIPLDIDAPIQITARARRVGSRQDAIRVAEYSQGY